MNITYIAKILILIGAVIILAGFFLWMMGKIDINWGKLPGDINTEGSKGSFHFPLMTSIIVSLVLTVLINLVLWIVRKGS
ncbi:MAG: DUF2905 domain-containing protein [Chlamydiae bacterium]|nr:DUF2905 domain-containing protein [Chlamydiota bacterium]